MFEHIQRLAYEVHRALKQGQISISRAQIHEGLAALLGYRTVASMKADPYVDELTSCFALILDAGRAKQRFVGLGLSAREADLVIHSVPVKLAELLRPTRHVPRESRIRVYLDQEAFFDDYAEYAALAVFESQEAADEMAVTNAYFDDVDIDSTTSSAADLLALQAGTLFEVRSDGMMSGDQIDEKMWTDNDIEFLIVSTFEKVGRVGMRHVSNDISASQAQSERG